MKNEKVCLSAKCTEKFGFPGTQTSWPGPEYENLTDDFNGKNDWMFSFWLMGSYITVMRGFFLE